MKWADYLDYLGGPNVIPRGLIRDRRFGVRERNATMGAEVAVNTPGS